LEYPGFIGIKIYVVSTYKKILRFYLKKNKFEVDRYLKFCVVPHNNTINGKSFTRSCSALPIWRSWNTIETPTIQNSIKCKFEVRK